VPKLIQQGFIHFLILILLVVGLLAGLYLVQNRQIFSPRAQTTLSNESLQDLTNQLLQKASNPASSLDRVGILDLRTSQPSLLEIAQARKQKALDEMKNDPNEFLQNALSTEVRNQLPDDIKPLIEQTIQVQGNFTVTHYDNFKDPSKEETIYTLETSDQKKYNLHFEGREPNILTDSIGKVNGINIDQEILVPKIDISNNEAEPSLQLFSRTQALSDSSSGNKRVLVLLLKFREQYPDGQEPFTTEQAKSRIFDDSDSVKEFYKVNSYRLFLSGEVKGWYTIPHSISSPCTIANRSNWETSAREAAREAQINLNSYTNVIYFFGEVPNCLDNGSLGWGNLGGPNSMIYAGLVGRDSEWSIPSIAHELGHNFGLFHAGLLKCPNQPIEVYGNCNPTNYGDPEDIMGSTPYLVEFNPIHKEILNGAFFNQHIQTYEINCGNETPEKEYTLAPYETTIGTQILKVRKCDTGDYYYLDYRTALGFDKNFPSSLIEGVNIHVPFNGKVGQVNRPGTLFVNSSGGQTLTSLFPGQSFIDPRNAVTIKRGAIENNEAVIKVSAGVAGCTHEDPIITIYPKNATVPSGSMSYEVEVINQDSPGCREATYQIKSQLPPGWQGGIVGALITSFKPGKIENFDYYIQPPANINAGIYQFTLTIEMNRYDNNLTDRITSRASDTASYTFYRSSQGNATPPPQPPAPGNAISSPSPSSAAPQCPYNANAGGYQHFCPGQGCVPISVGCSNQSGTGGLIQGPYPDLVTLSSGFKVSVVGGSDVFDGGYIAPGKSVSFSAKVANNSSSCIFSHMTGPKFYTSFSVYKLYGSVPPSKVGKLLPASYMNTPAGFYATGEVVPPNCSLENNKVFDVSTGSQWVIPNAGLYAVRVCSDSNQYSYSPGGVVEERNPPVNNIDPDSLVSNCADFVINSLASQNPIPNVTPRPQGSVGVFPITANASCEGTQPKVTLGFDFNGFGQIWGNRTEISSANQSALNTTLLLFGNFYSPAGAALQPNPISVEDPISSPNGYMSCDENQVCTDIGLNLPVSAPSNSYYPYFKSIVDSEWRHSYVNIFNEPLKPNTQYLYTFRTPFLDGGNALITTPNCSNPTTSTQRVTTQVTNQTTIRQVSEQVQRQINTSQSKPAKLFNQISSNEATITLPEPPTRQFTTQSFANQPTSCLPFFNFCSATQKCQLFFLPCQ
jgi:hypothetical protein